MPRLYGTVDVLDFDAKGYSAAVRKSMEIQFRHAARAFLRAAVPHVPVQTGMARGSFLHIGRYLNVAVPINPIRFNKTYEMPGGGKIPKTPESGASLSTSPQNLIKWRDNRLVFEFESNVFHYTLEDIFGLKSPTAPWESIKKGRIAFMEELRKLRTRLPKLGGYITRTSITFGRGSHFKSAPIRLRSQETIN